MAESTVSKEDVRAALEQLAAQGVHSPGLHRLQKHIGRGSLPRIKRLVGEIQNERVAALLPGSKPIPDPITALVSAIWNEFEVADAERVREAAEQAKMVQVEADERVAAAQAAHVETRAQLDTLGNRLAAALEVNAKLAEQAHTLQAGLSGAEAAIAGKDEMIRALQQSKQEMHEALIKTEQEASRRERELGQKIDQLHAERIEQAGFREQERREAADAAEVLRSTVARLQAEIDRIHTEHGKALSEKGTQLEVARSEAARLARDLATAEELARNLRSDLRATEITLAGKQQEAAGYQARIEQDTQRIERLEAHISELSNTVSEALLKVPTPAS